MNGERQDRVELTLLYALWIGLQIDLIIIKKMRGFLQKGFMYALMA